jgi:hypothetical protein
MTATIIALGVVAAVYALHRLALAGPLASIWARQDQTRGMYTLTISLLDGIKNAVTQLQSEAELPDWLNERLPRATELLDKERSQRDKAPANAAT